MQDDSPNLTRRRLLAWAGGLGVTALAAGCAGEATPTGAEPSGAPGPERTAATTGVDCVLSPEQTEGPFYVDLDRVRRDITEGRPGAPLRLRVRVMDADACEPLRDAAVDVWHCDAEGAYSGVQGDAGTFLRGIQFTGSDGLAEFRTIYPGWYSGRAVHVHVKVHVGAAEAYTGQLYFDETVTDEVYAGEPYSSRPGRDTLNTADGLYASGGDETLVTLTRRDDGWDGSVTLGVSRS